MQIVWTYANIALSHTGGKRPCMRERKLLNIPYMLTFTSYLCVSIIMVMVPPTEASWVVEGAINVMATIPFATDLFGFVKRKL